MLGTLMHLTAGCTLHPESGTASYEVIGVIGPWPSSLPPETLHSSGIVLCYRSPLTDWLLSNTCP